MKTSYVARFNRDCIAGYALVALFAASIVLAGSPLAAAEPAKYALLVGVRQYDKNELRSLPYTEADVTGLADVLGHSGYAKENIVLMTQTRGAARSSDLPLAANIRKELRLLLNNCDAGDSVLIALAGHGVQFKNSDEAFFCPMDAKLADKKTLISFKELYGDLEKCKADFKLVLADACRNDPQSDNSRSRAEVDLQSVSRPQTAPPPGGVAVFFSCSESERAFEHEDLKHGIFFNFVIEGLQGKAAPADASEITLNDLDSYVTRHVKDYVRSEYHERQVPEMVSKVRDLPVLVKLTRAKPMDLAGGTTTTLKPLNKPDELSSNKTPSSGGLELGGKEKPGNVITNTIGMKLAYIPAGEFLMGSPDSEVAYNGKHADDEKQHRVRIAKPFYIGLYAVTQDEYEKVIGDNPSFFVAPGPHASRVKGVETNRFPVESVSWHDAQKFCTALSKKEGKSYRLPTEAEWEYACRAGTTTPFSFGDKISPKQANFLSSDLSRPEPVGSYQPNAWGLYDMHGNISQWCQDWYAADYYSMSPAVDPPGPEQSSEKVPQRVARGGDWNQYAASCHAAHRVGHPPGDTHTEVGFRVVLAP